MKDKQYRISFYREILNDVGRQCRSTLASVDIRSARSMDRAIEAGKRRFARRRRIPVWDHLADGFEVEEFGRAAGPSESTRDTGRGRA